MAPPIYRVLAYFTALTLPCCAATCLGQDRPQGYFVDRSPVASVPDRSFSIAPVHDESTGEFPALMMSQEADAAGDVASGGALVAPVVTTVSSLLVVLAVFGGLVWISRRYGSSRTIGGVLPDDVLRNLGSAAVDAKTRVTFLKVGTRILVIGQTPTGGPQTLSEITDPDEVARLTNRCLGRPEIVGRRSGYSSGVESSRRDLAAG